MPHNWSHYNKFWVSLVMAVLVILDQVFGHNLGISEEFVTSIVVVIGTLLVYAIPNRA